MWEYRGQKRPPFAEEPEQGQESVWDYPRPPRVELSGRLVVVKAGSRELARTTGAYRVLETASPPGYYIPAEDVNWDELARVPGSSACEWKGVAEYWGLAGDPERTPVGWSYPDPRQGYEMLRGWISFYPGRVECFVDGERVRPQPGRFYGGWITCDLAGPFKGEPGTGHW
jgi:uncharacterized protein (DUF427 family)